MIVLYEIGDIHVIMILVIKLFIILKKRQKLGVITRSFYTIVLPNFSQFIPTKNWQPLVLNGSTQFNDSKISQGFQSEENEIKCLERLLKYPVRYKTVNRHNT